MKTVKFSLNELMSEIDESFIEEVYFHDCNKILKKYSKQKIRQNVFCKTASKHKPLKFTYRTAIIVTVVSVFLCMPVYAAISHLLTSALIDDSNRHLIPIRRHRIQKRLKIFRFREMIPISLTSGSSRIAGKDTILEDLVRQIEIKLRMLFK